MNGAMVFRSATRKVKGSTMGQPWEAEHLIVQVIVKVQENIKAPATEMILEFDAGDFSRALAKPGQGIASLAATLNVTDSKGAA